MEEQEYIAPRAIGVKWGLIAGVIGVVLFIVMDMANLTGNPAAAAFGPVITIALLVLAHRAYKSEGDGFLDYGQGIGIAFWMSLIGGLISSVFTYFYITVINSSFMEVARDRQIEEMEKKGLSEAQIEQAMEMAKAFSGPEFIAISSFLGSILITVILALIVTIFTKKARPEFE